MRESIEVRPAATVVCLRQGARGPEVLLVRRSAALAFHGGAWVFPGGAIDAGDADLERSLESLEAARRAAARECAEEVALRLEVDELVPLAHWTTPRGRTRRFATTFFLAEVAATTRVEVDGRELDAHRWERPDEALTLHRRGAIELPPPTFVTLTRLASHGRASEALDAARRSPFERFLPRIATVPDGEISLYQGDAGYETGDPAAAGPRHRLSMRGRPWLYERDADLSFLTR